LAILHSCHFDHYLNDDSITVLREFG